MPLNGHSYLVSQGWSGHGKGLREGSISRPLAIPQKRTLAGLGKDRDEAFPFWDHLFNAAAKSIQVKVFNDDDDSNTDNDSTPSLAGLNRTSTGLISNRRPTASSSGAATPDASGQTVGLRLSLLASAKREAAKRGLYARFFRGPVLGPDTKENEVELEVSAGVSVVMRSISPPVDDETEGPSGKAERKKTKDREESKVHKKEEKEKRRSEKEKRKRDKLKGKGRFLEVDAAIEDAKLKEDDGNPNETDAAQDKSAKRKHKRQKFSVVHGDEEEGPSERKRKRKREKEGDMDTTPVEGDEVSSKVNKKRTRNMEGNEANVGVDCHTDGKDRKRRKEERRKQRELRSAS